MIVTYLTLTIAILLSCIAAYYSVVGLAVIFASAAIPVIVMASTLEAGKVVAASWLYRNWHCAPRAIKYYLVVAVTMLMLITSMGIFGYLSKAHLDQAATSGGVSARVAFIDEQIKTSKDNISAHRKALDQMNTGIDQIIARSDTEKSAVTAINIRRSQAKERSYLLSSIKIEQDKIIQLMNEKEPLAATIRAVEKEVGPIKYIAALLYSDITDDVLDKAVRFVIILLVFVFDPLAIVLLLAANHSLAERKAIDDNQTAWLSFFDKSDVDYGNCPDCNTKLASAVGSGVFCPNKQCKTIEV